MAIPTFEDLFFPILISLKDGSEKYRDELENSVVNYLKLTRDEINMTFESGRSIFKTRLVWAKAHLISAGLLQSTRKGFIQLTEAGKKLLDSGITSFSYKELSKIPQYAAKRKGEKKNELGEEAKLEQKSAQELIEDAFQEIRLHLTFEVLETIKKCSPSFFENLVIDLLLKMGYGGSRKEAGESIGRSGDGGIDGIIKEDRLGLDIIYIQAKRWENQVPAKEIRDFAGSLLGKKAKKGIFLTTSSFPASAEEFTGGLEHKIILIDGEKLANLMIEHDVGVTTQYVYKLKKIDTDYFTEE